MGARRTHDYPRSDRPDDLRDNTARAVKRVQRRRRHPGLRARYAIFSLTDAISDILFLRSWSEKGLGRPKLCKLAHEFLWEYSYEALKLAQLLSKVGVFLTIASEWPL